MLWLLFPPPPPLFPPMGFVGGMMMASYVCGALMLVACGWGGGYVVVEWVQRKVIKWVINRFFPKFWDDLVVGCMREASEKRNEEFEAAKKKFEAGLGN